LKEIIENLYKIEDTSSIGKEKKKLVEYFFCVKNIIETRYGVIWEFNLRDLHRIFEYLEAVIIKSGNEN